MRARLPREAFEAIDAESMQRSQQFSFTKVVKVDVIVIQFGARRPDKRGEIQPATRPQHAPRFIQCRMMIQHMV
jgi:hypothetical protein